MKKNYMILIGSFFIAVCLVIVSYIYLGERSLFFRTFLILVLVTVLINIFYFRKHVAQGMRRGKSSRIKMVESFAILFFGIALLSLMNSFDLNVDWTSRKLFHLSKETQIILSNIKTPLKISIFSYEEKGISGLIDYAEQLAKRYEVANSKMIDFEKIDPIRNKSKADDYGVRQNGTIVFEMNGTREYVLPNILVENFQEGQISYKGETIFSAVIDKLNSDKVRTIYYLTGHGELDFDSAGLGGYDGIKQMIDDRRYVFKPINLDHYPEVPIETDILIIADPRTGLSSQTYRSIEKYVTNGGNTLYMVSKNTTEDLNIILMGSGFVYVPNVAVDSSRSSKDSGELSIIPTLSPKSEITLLLRNKRQSVIFPSSSIVYTLPQDLSDTNYIYDIQPLVKMSQNGFGERSFKTGRYQKDDKDISGIYCLAISSVVAPKDNLESQRRSIIFGSVDFIDNSRLYIGGNAELFLNSIDFLLRKDLKTTIAPKNEDLSISVPAPEQMRAIAVAVVAWILLWIVFSIVILVRRRNKVKKK